MFNERKLPLTGGPGFPLSPGGPGTPVAPWGTEAGNTRLDVCVCLRICLFVGLSVCLSVDLSVCVSVCGNRRKTRGGARLGTYLVTLVAHFSWFAPQSRNPLDSTTSQRHNTTPCSSEDTVLTTTTHSAPKGQNTDVLLAMCPASLFNTFP